MTARDTEIRRAQEASRVSDTLILQKINASHRVAFAEKFPGQIEHILSTAIHHIYIVKEKIRDVQSNTQ